MLSSTFVLQNVVDFALPAYILHWPTKLWPSAQLSSKRDFLSWGHFRSSIKKLKDLNVLTWRSHMTPLRSEEHDCIYKALFLIWSWYCNKPFTKDQPLKQKNLRAIRPSLVTDRLFDSKWFWKVLGLGPFTSTTLLHHHYTTWTAESVSSFRKPTVCVYYDNQKNDMSIDHDDLQIGCATWKLPLRHPHQLSSLFYSNGFSDFIC